MGIGEEGSQTTPPTCGGRRDRARDPRSDRICLRFTSGSAWAEGESNYSRTIS